MLPGLIKNVANFNQCMLYVIIPGNATKKMGALGPPVNLHLTDIRKVKTRL